MRRMAQVVGVVVLFAVGALAAEPWTAPTLADVEAALDGLGFGEFIEVSYRLHLLRFPQSVTAAGMAAEYGIRNDGLNDYSRAYEQETHAIESSILARLRGFDREALTEGQRVTYDIAEWYWDDVVRAQAFVAYEYPVHFMYTFSLHGLLEFTLTEEHPFTSEADVADYVTRLEKVGDQFDQIIAQLEWRADLGIIAPRPTLEWAVGDIRSMMVASAAAHPLLRHLTERAASIPGLLDATLDTYATRATTAIEDVVKPAYRRLYDEVIALLAVAPDAISLGQFEGGQDAYAYYLRHHTQTELSPTEIHALGLQEVERVQAEIRSAAADVGMPGAETASMTEIFAHAAWKGGAVSGDEAVDEAVRLIEKAERIVTETGALSRLPAAGVVAIGVANGGYYCAPALDGWRPGAYYVTTSGRGLLYRMPSVAYHETIPGHHVQLALAQEFDLPLLRQDVVFTGFSEGWALYAERLMSELGAYDDDPYGDLGRLQYELLRAVRLVTDTGIHDLGWSFGEAVAYIMQNTGDDEGTAQYRALRYTLMPGQATAYMVGLLELLELRDRARDALGDAFDLATFHDVLLGSGNVPLNYVEGIVDEWIAGALP